MADQAREGCDRGGGVQGTAAEKALATKVYCHTEGISAEHCR